ncbi:MAG: hypothetical protein HY728_09040, partial [Candidatus Rokubacteria bacterium]|nr:hypothetical protein [Candidatus Rokubacteria bacterium]
VQQLLERVQADLERLPKVVHFSLDGDHRAVFDSFARIGLVFTRRIERLREAYLTAVEAVMAQSGPPATASEALKTS